MQIQTAVIPVAGAGTRVFPMTTSIAKCMMPVYAGAHSRPLIDYMVEDCVRAGLKRIIFVTTEHDKVQLSDYFAPDINSTLRQQLETLGKSDKLEAELARRQAYGVQFDYIVQPANRYGTTLPLYAARPLLEGESKFALMGGDDFVYHPDGTSELGLAIQSWDQSGADHVIMGLPVPREIAPNYGILQIDQSGHFMGIDEKPPLDRVPEHPVANISRYLLSDSIWHQVEQEIAQRRGTNEHYITYPINEAYKAGQSFYVHAVTGTYLDGGTFDGLLAASQYVTDHPPTA